MSVETNDRKRQEMSTLILRLHSLGWTNNMLAVWMGVTPSTVARWYRAESMGTNAQRTELARRAGPPGPHLMQAAENLEREALASENLLEEAAARTPDFVNHAEYRRARARIERIRARVAALHSLVR